jgi:AraC-like DNA-binding protein
MYDNRTRIRREEAILVREDALPEHMHYRDDGCEVSPSCLRCPLPRCRYDEPGGIRSLLAESRDREIVRLRMEGWKVEDLADHFQVSRRSVFRILKRHTKTTPGGTRTLIAESEIAVQRTRRSA